MLSDLRDSGAIEQDADIVSFIYRPEYYQLTEWPDGTPCTSQAEIIVAKHRNGSLKDIRLKFLGKYAKFANLDGLSQDDFSFQGGIQPNENFGDNLPSFTMPSKMNDDMDEDDDDDLF